MKITFYLMTKKGFDVLNTILKEDKLKTLISEVVVGRDKNIENDFADEIISICKDNKINYFERNEKINITSNYSIAISWRWLINVNT